MLMGLSLNYSIGNTVKVERMKHKNKKESVL